MKNLKQFSFAIALLILSTSLNYSFVLHDANAIPPRLLDSKYAFGPLVGLSLSENGTTDWIISGNWRSSLTSDNETNSPGDSSSFTAAIDMIKPDGSGKHTHALTDFVLLNVTSLDSNMTIYNGTSTISLKDGPAVDIPTTIQKSNDNSVFIITIDPESVDNHFGVLPLYGLNMPHPPMNHPPMNHPPMNSGLH